MVPTFPAVPGDLISKTAAAAILGVHDHILLHQSFDGVGDRTGAQTPLRRRAIEGVLCPLLEVEGRDDHEPTRRNTSRA